MLQFLFGEYSTFRAVTPLAGRFSGCFQLGESCCEGTVKTCERLWFLDLHHLGHSLPSSARVCGPPGH